MEGGRRSSLAAFMASCTAAVTPSSTVASSTAAVLVPVKFTLVVPTLSRVAVLREFVLAVAVLMAAGAMCSAGVALRVHGTSRPTTGFPRDEMRAKLSA